MPKPVGSIPIWIGGTSDAAIARAGRADGYQGISMSPDEMVALVDRLREAGAGDDFVVSYRTGWDPNGMDHRQIVDEAEAYAEAGVHHVVAAPWGEGVRSEGCRRSDDGREYGDEREAGQGTARHMSVKPRARAE